MHRKDLTAVACICNPTPTSAIAFLQHDGSRGQENHPEAHASANLIATLATDTTRDPTSNKAEDENQLPEVVL